MPGGLLTVLTITVDTDPDPCADERHKTYYKCGRSAGHDWCQCTLSLIHI